LLSVDSHALESVERGVLAACKVPTTPNVSKGIEAAVRDIIKEAQISPQSIGSVMIGSEAFLESFS